MPDKNNTNNAVLSLPLRKVKTTAAIFGSDKLQNVYENRKAEQ